MSVRLRVLGEVDACVEGRVVDLGHRRRRCLLAVLAVQVNHPVPVDQLIDRVWGAHTPGDARSSVYGYVARLRRALADLPEVTIDRRAGGYMLSADPLVVDMHQFRELLAQARTTGDDEQALGLLAEALGLWRGEAFIGLDTPWLDAQRVTLHQERVAAELDQIDLRLRHGEHAGLMADLSARAAAHPLNERIAGQYMLALYRCGRCAEALGHYEHIRHHLAEELGADPGPQLRQLHEQILRNDPHLHAVDGTPTSMASPTPRQLPAPTPHFIGRAEELRRLTALLDTTVDADGTVVILAIGGAGGMGKTWLALHWAHQHVERFPDGQLFVDLRGFDRTDEPVPPTMAIRGFLTALGVAPDTIPTDLEAQSGLFRSLVAGKRILIVLDNAATTDQVIPLLPGTASCTVLVTSRKTLTALVTRYGAYHLPLNVLDRQEAHALLARRLGAARVDAEPVAAAELVRLCGYYPLALTTMAGRVHAHPGVPMGDFATELREFGLDALEQADPAASLPAVLASSVQGLTDQQRHVFTLLGFAPGPDIGLSAAANLTGLPLAVTHKVLRQLEETSLLDRHAHDRYTMHELVRRYATDTAHDRITDHERTAALLRVADFYLHTAYAANRVLNPHRRPIGIDRPAPDCPFDTPSDQTAALAWFDGEHRCLLAVQHLATVRQWHRIVWSLAWSLSTFHYRRGHRHDDLAVWQVGLAAAEHLPDPTIHTIAHRYLGRAYAALGRADEAIEHLRRALAVAEQHGDLIGQADAHRAFALAGEQWDDGRRALEHATHALELFRALDLPVWEANALRSVGWLSARLGRYEQARAHCQAALALHRHRDDPDIEAAALDSLAYIDHQTGHHHDAISRYQKAIGLLRGIGHTHEVARSLGALGHPYSATGRPDQAQAVWREALELYRKQGRDTDAERIQHQLDALDHRVNLN